MKRILIVEDDKRITAALSIRLTACGYAIFTAHNGFDGLKLALAERPDLILMDIMMPVGMGFSVAERLKDTACAQIPIIFITASKRTGLRRTAEKLGAAGFFEKPYDAEELLAAVALILGAATPAPACPPAAPATARPAI
jgi:DNA-binding response OmpR family regulator